VKDVSKKQLLEMLRQRDQRIEELQNENALLRQKVDLLIRKVFGASSEKLDPSQLDLFLLQAENAPGKSDASSALEEADSQRSRHRPSPKEKHLGVALVLKSASSSIMNRPGSFGAGWSGASTSRAKIRWRPRSSPGCRRCCRNGARSLPVCWRR
jgi:hypothetical protein